METTNKEKYFKQLIDFLDYYQDEYQDAMKFITKSKGCYIRYKSEEFFNIPPFLYNHLYNVLYEKIRPENPIAYNEKIQAIKISYAELSNLINFFEDIFNNAKQDDFLLFESYLYGLVYSAKLKVEEIIKAFEKEIDIKQDKIKNGVLIITTTNSEFEALKTELCNAETITKAHLPSFIFYETKLSTTYGNKIIYYVQLTYQGVPACVNVTTILLNELNPESVFMVGHLAGNKNRKDTIKLGHVLVATESVDYNQVEYVKKSNQEYGEKDKKHTIEINTKLKNSLNHFYTNNGKILSQKLKDKFEFDNDFDVHFGKVVTGSALLRDETKFEEIISNNSSLLGLDMETYGFYFACNNTNSQNPPFFASLKSVSDYGEKKPTTHNNLITPKQRQDFASKSSVLFLIEYIKNGYENL